MLGSRATYNQVSTSRADFIWCFKTSHWRERSKCFDWHDQTLNPTAFFFFFYNRISFYSGLDVTFLVKYSFPSPMQSDRLRSHVLHKTTTWPSIYIVVQVYILLAFQKHYRSPVNQQSYLLFKVSCKNCLQTQKDKNKVLAETVESNNHHKPCRRLYWLLWHRKGQISILACFEITYWNT